ncbi:hypothetical protein FRB99_001309 [Tulasnella sp. 403]|nr:hypothetical protein FRB99_001309 [Tulasnella sp. 403]
MSLVPFIRRFINKDTRTITLAMGTFPFAVERVVVYSVRASMSHAHHPGQVLSKGLLIYQQVSFALGFLSFATDCVGFVRALMVNTTLADPVRGSADQPRTRFWMRRAADIGGPLWLIATVPGGVAYGKLSGATRNQQTADKVFRLRTPSLNVLGTPPSSPLYPPDSLTTTPSKVTFYLFHCLPELIIATFIQHMNLRAVFNTGPFGDWRGTDRGSGIPQLRQNGVYVDGVGVPKKTTKRQGGEKESNDKEEGLRDGDAKADKETPPATVAEAV